MALGSLLRLLQQALLLLLRLHVLRGVVELVHAVAGHLQELQRGVVVLLLSEELLVLVLALRGRVLDTPVERLEPVT